MEGTAWKGPRSFVVAITFAGTKRFQVLRKLGEGGMGAVYESHDRETGARVALKTLLFSKSDTLLRFKHEFREFQHISHPNLVSLGELHEEDGLWFFTMELVEGTDFLSHVRLGAMTYQNAVSPTANTVAVPKPRRSGPDGGGKADLDEALLRDALIQLTRGLTAVHDVAKVHRDVKPSNVLVTRDGRVVLLDFGIAMDVSRREQLTASKIMGTPHYMAPEQAAGSPVSYSADWYSVGVMLYEALSGRLPFEGPLLKVLEDKQWRDPTPPIELNPACSPELNQLCMDLLSIRPEARPVARTILQRLGADESMGRMRVSSTVTRSDTQTAPFVGREAEMSALRQSLEEVQRSRQGVAVYVSGESGVGKSALVTHFTEEIRVSDPEAVILAGRCHEHEAVPYKAVDGLVDSLSKYMARLPKERAAALIPRYPTLLAQAFPVLWRIEAIAEHPRPRTELDPLELRSRVFTALREFLTRIADRHTLVLTIDDLQWADADSLSLLSEVLRTPDAPGLLLVATVRTEGTSGSVFPQAAPSSSPAPAQPPPGRHLHLGRLGPAESRELAAVLVKRAGMSADADVDAIEKEAGGHPLFIDELVRHRAALGQGAERPLQLEEALWSRICHLDDQARRLLEIICMAPGALMQATAIRAANIEGSDSVRYVKRLKAAHLARTTGGTRGTDLIEPYHARVRESVRANLTAEQRSAHHRRIALVLETTRQLDAEALTVHWSEAGEFDKASHYAREAAEKAEAALAFDRAAQFYGMCLEFERKEGSERRSLLIRLADALANAGRGEKSASAYIAAAENLSPRDALDLRRRAAEQLLRSGRIDAGMGELRTLLGSVGLKMADTPNGALAAFLWGTVKLKLRGVGYKERRESEIAPETLLRIDVCWAATLGLSAVDQIRSLDFQVKHTLLALDCGEPTRVARALGMEALSAAALDGAGGSKGAQLLGLAERAAVAAATPYAKAFHRGSAAAVAYMEGRWADTLGAAQEAENMLRDNCTGVSWEIASMRQFRYWSLCFVGQFDELDRAIQVGLRETVESGDLFGAMSIRSGYPNLAWLARHEPGRAEKEAQAAISQWSREGVHLQHLMDLVARVHRLLYVGEADGALAAVTEAKPKILGSHLPKVQLNRILIADLEMRALLAALGAGAGGSERDAWKVRRQLGAESAPWAQALGELAEAQLHALAGHPKKALPALDLAIRSFDGLSMALHASATRRCRLFVTDDEASRTAQTTAATYFKDQRVQRPDVFARVFAPGFWRAFGLAR